MLNKLKSLLKRKKPETIGKDIDSFKKKIRWPEKVDKKVLENEQKFLKQKISENQKRFIAQKDLNCIFDILSSFHGILVMQNNSENIIDGMNEFTSTHQDYYDKFSNVAIYGANIDIEEYFEEGAVNFYYSLFSFLFDSFDDPNSILKCETTNSDMEQIYDRVIEQLDSMSSLKDEESCGIFTYNDYSKFINYSGSGHGHSSDRRYDGIQCPDGIQGPDGVTVDMKEEKLFVHTDTGKIYEYT